MLTRDLTKIKIGSKVLIECYSGLGTSGYAEVTDLSVRYDRNSGEPYPVIIVGNREFDGTTGNAVTPPTAYYIFAVEE